MMAIPAAPSLERLTPEKAHSFGTPAKLINDGADLQKFFVSQAYRDILTFLAQLNRSMFPRKTSPDPSSSELDTDTQSDPTTVLGIRTLLQELERFVDKAPPDPGPRRFGNISFRKWFDIVEAQTRRLLEKHLPSQVTLFKQESDVDSIHELSVYLLGAFGSKQRLDYGTGHELSFIAFLAGVWKLGGFAELSQPEAEHEIVMGVVQPYLTLIRKLILTYNLEPAGTHGVWGLDDHSFVPYIFGSAQFGPAISDHDLTPTEGSSVGAPDPGDVAKSNKVQALRADNLYFGAIGFVYDVKKGPFWEHSPTLYDISGVKAGWAKINKGMMKMYNAEVLSKFPVVQHFPFGSLFKWELDANAIDQVPDIHARSQPATNRGKSNDTVPGPVDVTSTMQGAQAGLTKAPWAMNSGPPKTRQQGAIGRPPPTAVPVARFAASSSMRTKQEPAAESPSDRVDYSSAKE